MALPERPGQGLPMRGLYLRPSHKGPAVRRASKSNRHSKEAHRWPWPPHLSPASCPRPRSHRGGRTKSAHYTWSGRRRACWRCLSARPSGCAGLCWSSGGSKLRLLRRVLRRRAIRHRATRAVPRSALRWHLQSWGVLYCRERPGPGMPWMCSATRSHPSAPL